MTSLTKYVRTEYARIICDTLITATGFLAALLINSAVDDWKERRAYSAMVYAVQVEAKSNETILEESFLRYIHNGVVFREFDIGCTIQTLANPSFVKHSHPSDVEALGQYVRNLRLANTYRAKVEIIRFNKDYSPNNPTNVWERPLVDSWSKNLDDCKASIEAVTAIKP